jgi:baculoviral IAP repeat-containing protein 7/8
MNQPLHREYKDFAARLETFYYWPQERLIKGRRLARAGFFFTGIDDCVRCFNCDGGLQNFEWDDEPEAMHALYFSECEFLCEIMNQ